MPLIGRNLPTVTERDLQSLIDAAVREQREIEYKQRSYGDSSTDHSEFMADVASFANASGGDIVIGIAAQKGIPTSLTGIGSGLGVDGEILRLEQMARTGISPRIPGLTLRAIDLPSMASAAIVIRIPKSYRPPHRVVYRGANRFWTRSAAGKYEPDIDELRSIFTEAPNLAQRLREICRDRLVQIELGQTPLPLTPAPATLVIHVVPFSAANMVSPPLNIEQLLTRTTVQPWRPWNTEAPEFRRNFDGVIMYRRSSEMFETRAYVQIFRTSLVECVATGISRTLNGQDRIDIETLENGLLHQIERIVSGLRSNDIDAPCAVLITLMNVRGSVITSNNPMFANPPLPIERDTLTFVDAVVPEGTPTQDSLRFALRPLIDQLYHAGATPAPDGF